MRLTVLSLLVVGVLALNPPGFAGPSPPNEAAAESRAASERYVLRWALLRGLVQPSKGAEASGPVARDAGAQLFDWDFRRDEQELMDLFRLASLETVQHGQNLFSGEGDTVFVGIGQGTQRLAVEIALVVEEQELQGEELPVARARFKLSRGDELLSAPMILSRLGERAIVATSETDPPALLYLVMQVDPVSRAGESKRQ